MKIWIRNIALCMSTLLLAACASTESKLAVPYVLELKATNNVNAGQTGKAHPIKVIVYELNSSNAFNQSDYFSLQKDARQALGDQMLGVNSVVLSPGETKEFKSEGNLQAKMLGIIAGYRDIHNAKWRLLIDLPEAETTNFYKFWQFSPDEVRIQLEVGEQGLSVVPTKK